MLRGPVADQAHLSIDLLSMIRIRPVCDKGPRSLPRLLPAALWRRSPMRARGGLPGTGRGGERVPV